MAFHLLPTYVAPAEGEATVRTYHCTSLSARMLRLRAEGYLTVTNKRVIFYAFGSSYGGTSVFLSEVPIADVSGINAFKGTYFSLSHLLVGVVVSFILGNILNAIVSALVLGITKDGQALGWLALVFPILLVALSFRCQADDLKGPVLASTASMLAFSLAGLSAVTSLVNSFGSDRDTGVEALASVVGLVSGLYALYTFFMYARRETMSLVVGSKGGSSTPIIVSGVTGFGFYNTAALKALNAEPAQDAETMIKELGALIADVQTLGDLGLQKWQAPGRDLIAVR